MAIEKVKRTIDSLKAIYAVIIGLAISDAIEAIAKDQAHSTPIKVCLLLSFFAFAIPFFHGMNRHLDVYHSDAQEHTKQKKIFLLIDFLAFFSEGCFLFFFAINLCKYWLGFEFLAFMIVVDFLWAFILLLCLKKNHADDNPSNLRKWMLLDVVTLIVGGLFYVFIHHCNPDLFTSTIIICILSIVRTIIDFTLSWSFYFPEDQIQL